MLDYCKAPSQTFSNHVLLHVVENSVPTSTEKASYYVSVPLRESIRGLNKYSQ